MPQEYTDCVKKVKKSLLKQGKSEKQAEKSAYAICVAVYKKKHGKTPQSVHSQGENTTDFLQKNYGSAIIRDFDTKMELKEFGEYEYETVIPAMFLDNKPVNNLTTEKMEQVPSICLEAAAPLYKNLPIWYGHQRTNMDLLGFITNPKYNDEEEHIVGNLHLYGKTPLQREIIEGIKNKEITHVSSTFVPDFEIPIENEDNGLTHWQVGIRPIEVSVMPPEGKAFCSDCQIIHNYGVCPTTKVKEKKEDIMTTEEKDKLLAEKEEKLKEAEDLLKKYGKIESVEVLKNYGELKTAKAEVDKKLSEQKETYDKVLKEYGEYKKKIEKKQKDTTVSNIVGKLKLEDEEVKKKTEELDAFPQDKLDGILIGMETVNPDTETKSYGVGEVIPPKDKEGKDKEDETQAKARRIKEYGLNIKTPEKKA